MRHLSARICQAYLLVALLAAGIMSPLPYSLLAVALLLAAVLLALRPVPARVNLVASISFLFLVPLLMENVLPGTGQLPPVIVQTAAAMSALPILFLLNGSLKQNAGADGPADGSRRGLHMTVTSRSLFVLALAMFLLSLFLDKPALLFVTAIFTLYLACILLWVMLVVPTQPLDTPLMRRRVVAGTTLEIGQYILSRASVPVHGLVRPANKWVKATPSRFTLGKGKSRLSISITPPLAGPARPALCVSALDPWGFVQVDQLIEPVELHVIPRARYAAWLANKYLEGAGETGVTPQLPRNITVPMRGIDYHDSRDYQPGDQLKDIDWKHTVKYNQLIIKECIDSGRHSVIIAANLSVADAEEADKLAFNLITTALTLAREEMPAALAAYNNEAVILTLATTNPGEILRQALSLVKRITPAQFTERYLALPDLDRLKRNIGQLRPAQGEPAQRLLGILDFEYRAVISAARDNPATIALSSIIERTSTPAMIFLISERNHDAEAIQVAVTRLRTRDFSIVSVDGRQSKKDSQKEPSFRVRQT